jgi:hypothetical protein
MEGGQVQSVPNNSRYPMKTIQICYIMLQSLLFVAVYDRATAAAKAMAAAADDEECCLLLAACYFLAMRVVGAGPGSNMLQLAMQQSQNHGYACAHALIHPT